MKERIRIKGFNDEEFELKPHLHLVKVTDLINGKMHNIGISFSYKEDGNELPFANFTLNFGEYIALKNCAYVDTNNCWFADEIIETGIASDTGLTKISGYYKYPLWKFDEDFLKSVNEKLYREYSDEYDQYMSEYIADEDDEDDLN